MYKWFAQGFPNLQTYILGRDGVFKRVGNIYPILLLSYAYSFMVIMDEGKYSKYSKANLSNQALDGTLQIR